MLKITITKTELFPLRSILTPCYFCSSLKMDLCTCAPLCWKIMRALRMSSHCSNPKIEDYCIVPRRSWFTIKVQVQMNFFIVRSTPSPTPTLAHCWSESPFAESPSKVPEQPLLLCARLGHIDPIGLGVLLEIARVPGKPKLWHYWRLQILRPHPIPIYCLEEAEMESCSIVVNFIIIYPTSPWLGRFQFFSPMFFHVLSTVSQVAQPFVCVLWGKKPRHFVTKGVTAPSSSQKAWSSTSSFIIITIITKISNIIITIITKILNIAIFLTSTKSRLTRFLAKGSTGFRGQTTFRDVDQNN